MMKQRRKPCCAVLVLLLGAVLSVAVARADDVPAAINYQGELADNLGYPLTSGYYHIEFRIWDSPTAEGAANLIWGRMFPLHVMSNGIFNVLLTDDGGEVTDPTPQTNDLRDAFAGEDRFLGLTITRTPSGDVTDPEEIQPRQQLVSAPYAFHAQHATAAIEAEYATDATDAAHAVDSDSLGGVAAADYMLKSRFPGTQDPATLVTWDGDNAAAIDAHVSGLNLVAEYVLDANGFVTTNGVVTPGVGPGVEQGIEFPPNPGGGNFDRAWIKYSVVTNEDCQLEIGVNDNENDVLSLYSSGGIEASGKDVTLTATDTLLLDGAVTLGNHAVQVLGSPSSFTMDVWYQASGDGFVTFHGYSGHMRYYQYSTVAGEWITDSGGWQHFFTDGGADTMTMTMPVGKGDKLLLATDDWPDSWRIVWRPLGHGATLVETTFP
jgi:hypothetical protein